MRRKRKYLFWSVFFMLVVVVILDFVLGSVFIPYNYNHFRIKHPVYHHGIKPDISTMAAWGPLRYKFYSSSMGFRDLSQRDINISRDNKRILLMGDSHTEGVGIDYNFTFGGRLQIYADKNNVEVLNAAAVSYSPRIHYLKGDYLLNKKKLEIDEIWVFVDISDLQNELAYEPFYPEYGIASKLTVGMERFFRNNSLTYYSLYNLTTNKEMQEFSNALSNFNDEHGEISRNTLQLYKDFFSDFDDNTLLQNPQFHGVSEWIYDSEFIPLAQRGIELGQNNIKKLNAICKEKDIILRLSVHPWQKQVVKGDTTGFYVEAWRSFCKSEDIHFINLFPVFVNEENPYLVNSTCYIANDNHWNEIGHKRVFEHIVSYLDEK